MMPLRSAPIRIAVGLFDPERLARLSRKVAKYNLVDLPLGVDGPRRTLELVFALPSPCGVYEASLDCELILLGEQERAWWPALIDAALSERQPLAACVSEAELDALFFERSEHFETLADSLIFEEGVWNDGP